MQRELRKRKLRPNYAALLGYEDENGAGPSTTAPTFDEEMDSGSDFAPEAGEEQDELEEGDEDEDGMFQEEVVESLQASSDREESVLSVRAAKSSRRVGRRTVALAPGISLSRQTASNAVPSLHHRHRAIPIHQHKGGVERLKEPPHLFAEPEILPTKGWFSNETLNSKVNKSWGYNVGPGPLWEILEDRAWFKEAMDEEQETEATRRPKVYQDILGVDNCEILSHEDATTYLPSADASSGVTGATALKCLFGPVGEQQEVETRIFDTLRMDTFFPGSKSHVFNAGAPVWGLDWCPVHPDDRKSICSKQYLAVGPLPSQAYSPEIGVKTQRPAPACIQIWSLSASPTQSIPEESEDPGIMKCELVLCIDGGPAHELRWCPLPSHDSLKAVQNHSATPRKLGLLAGTFEDGSLSIYAVPYPTDLTSEMVQSASGPVFVKLSPLVRFELEDTACWSLDWANSEVIAVGCTNGAIAVYNVKHALQPETKGNLESMLPTHYFHTHQCAIRCVAWIRAPTFSGHASVGHDDPTVIVGGGYDGLISATDIREPYGNEIYRTRDVVNSVCYSTYSGGPISLDQGQVKAVALAPVMLNKGHTLLDPDGPVWSMHMSDYHPQLAVGVTDGSCITTNTLRTTRRGGSVPFLMHKIYQLDYSRKTGKFRMLDHILPKEIDRVAGVKAVRPAIKGSGAWPPEMGVQRVVWNNGNGLANASLLASATGCGLCRIDWLTGKWLNDRVPYHGIEGIRCEIESDDEMDEDSD